MTANEAETHAGAAVPDPAKQIKVKLPIEIILRLQEIRITEGRSVADVVTAAVNEYLARNYRPRRPSRDDEPNNQVLPERR